MNLGPGSYSIATALVSSEPIWSTITNGATWRCCSPSPTRTSRYFIGTDLGPALDQDRSLMPFISYAQNMEDVMLYRALRDVTRGFYVDVGANSPDRAFGHAGRFYERGWRGINIEPVPGFHEQLVAARPHDINLAVAVGDSTGTVNFYDIPDSGLPPATPNGAPAPAFGTVRIVERQVPVGTLDHVFENPRRRTGPFSEDRRGGHGERRAARPVPEDGPALDHRGRGDGGPDPDPALIRNGTRF